MTIQQQIKDAGETFAIFIKSLGPSLEIDLSLLKIQEAVKHALDHSAATDAETAKHAREGTSTGVGKGHHGGDPFKS